MGFKDVQDVLDRALAGFTTRAGHAPDLTVHGDDPFGWSTPDELKRSKAKGQWLIQPDVIGNGRGALANIVIDLAKGLKVGPRTFPRMPFGGPFLGGANGDLADPDLKTIIDWIDGGCLPDPS